MAKGTVEAIARDEIPEDLSGVAWTVLQATAKQTLGIDPIQKRPQLEDAMHLALGRAVTAPALDGAGEPGEAGPVGEDDLADLDADYDDLRDVPQFDVGSLPDVGLGEAPPADPLPQAPASAPEPEPVASASPVRPAVLAAPRPATWLDDEKAGVLEPYTGLRFPEPPVGYISKNAKLLIQIASGGRGRFDSEGLWQEARPAKGLQFGPEGGHPLFQCVATTRAQVKAMETSKKFKTGRVWRARDEAERAVADAERHLAIVKAQARGDKATLAELMATQPRVLEGARTTRNEPLPDGVGAAYIGPFAGVNAMLADTGRAGAVLRDGIRHAQARGEPGF